MTKHELKRPGHRAEPGETEKRLTRALQRIEEIPLNCDGGDWDEIEEAQAIAREALRSLPYAEN